MIIITKDNFIINHLSKKKYVYVHNMYIYFKLIFI